MFAPRTALVTGASRGIGRAIALALAAAGYAVAITARDADALALVASEIAAQGSASAAIPVDLVQPDAALLLHAAAVAAIGPIDVLVNNAGIGASANLAPVASFDDDAWDRTIHVNLTVPYRLSRAVLPGMIERGWGRIVNIASIHAAVPLLFGAAYTASKHGLLGLTRTAAQETARDGVTVNAICPGPVRSRLSDARIAFESERLGVDPAAVEAGMTSLGRRLDPVEIAPLVLYLASDAAAGMTGQSLTIGG